MDNNPWIERQLMKKDGRDWGGCDLCGKNKRPGHTCYAAGHKAGWKDSGQRRRRQWDRRTRRRRRRARR